MRSSSAASTPASTLRNPTFDTPHIPTIRLTTATPTASEAATSRQGTPSVLAPKAQPENRKRLVPKKSKLSLLVGNKRNDKGKDLSDVARRVGVPPSSVGRSFDIYVDPADDPDIGEIVVLKKKKSRGGLNDVRWAPLEEVTNITEETEVAEVKTIMKKPDPAPATIAVKSEDKEKWWTLGRNRRDSKELKLKGKENSLSRAKSFAKRPTRPSLDIQRSFQPEKTDSAERQRSQSFDGTRLLNGGGQPQQYPRCITVPMPDDDEDSAPPRRTHTRTMTSPSVFSPGAENLPEGNDFAASRDGTSSRNGSIALRAMRSVRSMARIGSWSQLKNMPAPECEEKPEEQKPSRKPKKRTGSMRLSRGSIEVLKEGLTSIRRKSVDVSGTMRSVSSQSTAVSSAWSDGTGRPSRRTSSSTAASSIHTNSSGESNIEPIIGRPAPRSSASSIRWDDQTETIKEKHMRGSRRDSIKKEKGSKKTLSGRRRPSLASLFSDIGLSKPAEKPRTYKISAPIPIPELLPFHVDPDSSGTLLDEDSVLDIATPKRVRPRPLSEDVFGRNRPSALISEEDGAIQVLNEATSDLANLINRLDLEATPHATPRGKTPKSSKTIRQINHASNQSPTGKNSKSLSAEKSTDSLRSYALRMRKKSHGSMNMLGNYPEPVPELPAIFKGKELQNSTCEPDMDDEIPVLRLPQHMQRKSTSPSYPRTMPSYSALPVMRAASLPSPREMAYSDADTVSDPSFRASSSLFIGHSSKTSTGTTVAGDASYSVDYKPGRTGSVVSQELSSPLLAGLDSIGSRSRRSSKQSTITSSAKDFDIPVELQQLLRRNFNRDSISSVSGRTQLGSERSFAAYPLPPSPGTPPDQPLPSVQVEESMAVNEQVALPSGCEPENVPLAGDTEDEEEDEEEDKISENDTKKSFDFTAELSQLTGSKPGDRRSFVIQLETAFKTPTKSDLRNLAANLGYGKGDASVEVPPMPSFRKTERTSIVSSQASQSNISVPACIDVNRYSSASDDMTSVSNPTDEDVCVKQPSMVFSSRADRSVGRLDKSFQFGGVRNLAVDAQSVGASLSRSSSINSYTSDKPLNLSDIIPPPEHESRRQSFVSISEEESSLLQSILNKVEECSIISGSNRSSLHEEVNRSLSEARLEALAQLTTHSRRESEISFSGLSTFSEIRRGFEFGTTRPVFYPPTQPSRNLLPVPNHQWRTSLFSVASVSSYGQVIRPGLRDPFDYEMPVYAEPRPVSEDMSYTVDDTFSFMHHGLAQRQRVDSDASNFSFHPPPAFGNNQQRRNRRQVDSMISVASGPPVSLYNRGFGHYNSHKWTVEQALGLNANGPSAAPNGRPSAVQRNGSTESLASNYSAQRLGRPGIGDKMFDSAQTQTHDYGVPLSMISASPSQLESSRLQTTFDSILDDDPDSQTNEIRNRSILGGLEDERINHSLQAPHLPAPIQLRPVSVYSIASQNNSPKRDDDTMISMLGGGWVRRRSIGSTLQGSPCARAEKRQHRGYAGRVLARIPSGDVFNDFDQEEFEDEPKLEERYHANFQLPEKVDLFLEPVPAQDVNKSMESIVSSSRSSIIEHHFGEGRMDMARKGLLERQSLEDCCLSAEGEDTTTSRRSYGVFNKPEPAFRSRVASRGHGSLDNNTPPLSVSGTSSHSSISQHSIDLAKLDAMLANANNAPGPSDLDKVRLRPRGQGHRYRRSHVRASWTSSVYETIEEEGPELLEEERLEESVSQRSSLLLPDIKVVQWENEDVGPALRKMLELQAEARQVLSASRNQWEDTPFSLFALQSFKPPKNPAGMRALLEHSQKAFGPLPIDLRGCHRRARTTSRPSPYPRNRVFHLQANGSRASLATKNSETEVPEMPEMPVMPVMPEPTKEEPVIVATEKPAPSHIPVLKPLKSFASFTDKTKGRKALQTIDKNNEKLVIQSRAVDNGIQKIVAAASKKGNVGKSPRKVRAKKENATDNVTTKASENLRIVRPRPKGRPALASRALRI